MNGHWEIGRWERTPLWLRLIGWPPRRRWTVLNSYHVFSEWEYSHG